VQKIYNVFHEFTEIYRKLQKFTQIYTNLDKFRQIYTNLDKFRQIYTNLHKFTQIYTNLHKFTQIYTNLQNNDEFSLFAYLNWIVSPKKLKFAPVASVAGRDDTTIPRRHKATGLEKNLSFEHELVE
jgi:hypothetical protein